MPAPPMFAELEAYVLSLRSIVMIIMLVPPTHVTRQQVATHVSTVCNDNDACILMHVIPLTDNAFSQR